MASQSNVDAANGSRAPLSLEPEHASAPCEASHVSALASGSESLEPFPGKLWLDPAPALEAALAVCQAEEGLKATQRAPPLGRCFLMNSGGDSEHLEMRWDGLHYRCTLQLEAQRSAFFQVGVSSGLCIHPDRDLASPERMHELLGPDDWGRKLRWHIAPVKETTCYEVFLPCPRGCPVALTWCRQHCHERRNEKPRVGNWEILDVLGQGFQGAVVYKARWQPGNGAPGAGLGGLAALKFPVLPEELQVYAMVHDVRGVPSLLDFGRAQGISLPGQPAAGLYIVMSVATPSLDFILRGQLSAPHLAGRLSWPVASSLGLKLLRCLQALHRRGIVHCDLKPGNVLMMQCEPWLQLIDFGRSGLRPRFEVGHGGMRDYMSVKAGLEGGERTPIDDLESLGWLLLKCVLGQLPWNAKAKPHEDETWTEGSQRVARDKLRFLELNCREHFDRSYCPPNLATYLRLTLALAAQEDVTEADYDELARLLDGEADLDDEFRECAWKLLSSSYYAAITADGFDEWPSMAITLSTTLWWRASVRGGSETSVEVETGTLLRLTGRSWTEKKEGMKCAWVEIDPVWQPGLPHILLRPGWILADGIEPGTRKGGQWLAIGIEAAMPPSGSQEM